MLSRGIIVPHRACIGYNYLEMLVHLGCNKGSIGDGLLEENAFICLCFLLLVLNFLRCLQYLQNNENLEY